MKSFSNITLALALLLAGTTTTHSFQDLRDLSAKAGNEHFGVGASVSLEQAASAHSSKGEVSASARHEAKAEASANVKADYGKSGVKTETDVSAKANIEAAATGAVSANKFDGVKAAGGYKDVAQAGVNVRSEIGGRDAGIRSEVSATAKAGASVEGEAGIRNGIQGSGSTFAGASAGVAASSEGRGGIFGGKVGVGASAGPQVGIGGGGHVNCEKGEISVGVSGDVAAALGLNFDVEVSVDTKPVGEVVEQGAKSVCKTVEKGAKAFEPVLKPYCKDMEPAGKQLNKSAEKVGKEVGKVAKDVEKKLDNAAEKIGEDFGKVAKGVESVFKLFG